MDQPKEARISYRGTPEQRKRLKALAVERDTSVQQILDEAVQSYLKQGNTYADFEIDEATLRQFQIPAAGRAEFVSAAPHLQLEGIPEPDPDVTPQNEHERALVQAVLALDRENGDYPEFRKTMYVLLERWLPKGFKFNSGKKTA